MHMLFDFDGTLVESFQCVIEKTIMLADEFHFRKIQPHEVDALRDLSSLELVRFLGVPMYKIPALIQAMRRHLYADMPTLSPVNGIREALETLHQKHHTLGILTSNSTENIERWLKLHHMHHLFSFIHTESNGLSKRRLIKKTLKKYKISPEKACYIGDETRDIEAAKKNNLPTIAVTWGYNSEKALRNQAPSAIVTTPDELLKHLIKTEPTKNSHLGAGALLPG